MTYPPPPTAYGSTPASPERTARIVCAVIGVLAVIGILVVGHTVSDAAPSGTSGLQQGAATNGNAATGSGSAGGTSSGGSSSGGAAHTPGELKTNFPFPPGNDDVESSAGSLYSTDYLVAGTPTSVRAFYAATLPTYGVGLDGSQLSPTLYRFDLVYPSGDTRSGNIQIKSSGPGVTAGHVQVEASFFG